MEEARNQSIEAQHRHTLPEVDWTDVHEAGCYVDQSTGDLFRIPKEALIAGASPMVVRESAGASRLRQLGKDPFMPTMQARLLCAQHNIRPNF
ncbi:MAG TPA: hypothetical protein VE592_03870 [Geminicoccaceae bacterium]|jgi:hypothetical protein|nr:hypothetical protein [Geminicoccaceae bacterium]